MQATDPNSSAIEAARARLGRLEQYLLADANNHTLLTDAFETALRCGEFEHAVLHLRQGLASDQDPWGWRLKEGDYWLAQRGYDEAQTVLEQVLAEPALPAGLQEVVLHNLAYIDLQRGAFDACVERLSPLMDAPPSITAPTVSEVLAQALQSLWLRALHRTGDLARAFQWASDMDALSQLSPSAQGVASLIALDAENLPLARQWANNALPLAQQEDRPLEALTVLASLALGDNSAAQARKLATAGLQLQPEDGRCWSVLAFADLLAGDLTLASDHFARSLHAMPEHIGTWHGLAWTQILQHQLDDAHDTFDKALAMNRNFAESHGGLAVVCALRQQQVQAQEHIERALRLEKSCLSAQYAQAIINGETQDTQRFNRLAKRLLGGRASGLGGSLLDKVEERVESR